MAEKPDLLQTVEHATKAVVEKDLDETISNPEHEIPTIDDKTGHAANNIVADHDESGNKQQQQRKWRGPPKNSLKYGIKQSLQKKSVRYVPPKLEETPKPNHPCSPCSRERKRVESTSYCPECNESLCETCTVQHKKFQILKMHKVLDIKEAKKDEATKPVVHKLSETCGQHANKLVDMYCRQHDEVGCAACIAVNHKTCMEPEYITKIAQNLARSDLPKQTKEELSRTKKDINMLKVRRLEDKERLKKEKNDILVTIETMRSRLVERINQLEHSAKEQLSNKYDKDMMTITTDIQSCDEAIASLEKALNKMNVESASQLVINIKKDAKKSLKRGGNLTVAITERLGVEEVQFTIDESLEEWIGNISALGKFDHEQSVYTGVSFGKFDINHKNDHEKENYIVNGVLNAPSGLTIVSDWKNRRLKLLDNKYNLQGHCEIPGCPYSLCSVNPGLIALTIRDEKIVQLVSLEDREMKLDRKFKVDEFCRGIGYRDNQIFVTCGGGEGEVHGQLRVYSMSGALVRVYEEDLQGKPFFSKPRDIVINNEGTRFHVSDLKRGVVTITKDGRLAWIFQSPNLKSPLGLCTDSRGNLYVSGNESNNVIQLSADGRMLGEVLKESDGIDKPLAICCHEAVNPRLMVSSENSCAIKVFTLQEK